MHRKHLGVTRPHPGTSARPVRGNSTCPDLMRPVNAGCGLPASHGVTLPFLYKWPSQVSARIQIAGHRKKNEDDETCTDQASSHPCSCFSSMTARRAPNSASASGPNHRVLISGVATGTGILLVCGRSRRRRGWWGVMRHSSAMSPYTYSTRSLIIFDDVVQEY